MYRIFLSLALLALAGCVESPVPLESGGTVSDPALIGTWKSDLDGDPMVATIRQEANGALVADVQAYWEPGPKAATKHYQIVLAKFDGALVKDLELKKLPGELKPDRHLSTVELNASSEQLRDYFASHGANAFHEQPLMAFERVSSAVLPPPRTQQDRDRDPPGFNEVAPCRP
jgi:hypothetical protein